MAEIKLTQHIEAPPDTVYRYLTEQEKWSLWQGVEASLVDEAGGLFSMTMGNGMIARGKYVELVEDARIVFTWGWVGHTQIPPGSTIVEIDLHPDGNGTLLTLTHRNIPEDEAPLQKMGWTHYLPRLAAVASGTDPGPDLGPR